MLSKILSVSVVLGALVGCQSAPKPLVSCQEVVKKFAEKLGDDMDIAVPFPIPDGGIVIQVGDDPRTLYGLIISSPHFFKHGLPKPPPFLKVELKPEQCQRDSLPYEVREFKSNGQVQVGAPSSPEF